MGRMQDDKELDELLRRLGRIEKKLPKKDAKPASTDVKLDRFAELKTMFMTRLSQIKSTINDMQADRTNVSRTRDAIEKQQKIRSELKALQGDLKEMATIHAKQRKKGKRSKLSGEQLQAQATYLQQFEYQLREIKESAVRGYVVDGSSGAAKKNAARDYLFSTLPQDDSTASGSGSGSAGAGVGAAREVDLTEEQKQGLALLKERDLEFDQQLDQIHKVIVETGEIAIKIGETADLHQEMLDKAEENLGRTEEHLDKLVNRLEKTLDSKGMSAERMCINLILLIVLLGVIGVIVNLASGSG